MVANKTGKCAWCGSNCGGQFGECAYWFPFTSNQLAEAEEASAKELPSEIELIREGELVVPKQQPAPTASKEES